MLVVQRTYFQISVDYVEALDEMRRAEVAILGPPSLMVMLVPAGFAALFWVGLVAVLVAAVSAVHLAGTSGLR